MSLIGDLVSVADTVLLRSARAIGPLLPQVVVEESHRDSMIVTDHPVEMGSMVSDHAFRKPSELIIRAGWSNSGVYAGSVTSQIASFGGFPGYVQAIYLAAVELMNAAEPLIVITGKRVYDNMLIVDVTTVTDASTENALMVTIRLREVILVQTSATTIAPASSQAEPQTTAGIQNTGSKQLQAVADPQKQSILYGLAGLVGG